MRVLPVCLLLAASILAGCFQSPADPDPGPGPDPPHTLVHRGDETLDSGGIAAQAEWWPVAGYDAREPTIAVTSDGSLFYAARDYSGGSTPGVTGTQTPVMRSTDGGRTWEDVSPRLPTGDRSPPRSGDPMLVADPWTDRIFQIELYDLVCNWIVFSDDGGGSWTDNPKACGTFVVDHQTITSGPPATTPAEALPYENIVYVCVNQLADSNCARSLDGGLTFGPSVTVYPQVEDGVKACGGIHGHALVDPAGTVYLPREYCGRPYVAVSPDEGVTWTLHDVGGPVGAYFNDPNMAFDGAGNVYLAWTGEDQDLWLVWSGDQGTTWSPPSRISHPGLTYANHVSITAGDDGRLGFVFLGSTDEPEEDDWTNVTWQAYMGVTHDATAAEPTVTTIQANPPGDAVYRGDCRSIRCGYIREFLDASVAPDGTFWGAFVDACLTVEERKYEAYDSDCNAEPDDYGQGNGHLGYAGRAVGAQLYAGAPVVSGGG